MISNERLEDIVSDCSELDGYEDIAEIARETLALRKAFSDPVAWRHDDGPFGDVVTPYEKVAEAWKRNGLKLTPLYEKPPIDKA